MSKRGPYFICPFCGFRHLNLSLVNEHIIRQHNDKIHVYRDKDDWGGWIKTGIEK